MSVAAIRNWGRVIFLLLMFSAVGIVYWGTTPIELDAGDATNESRPIKLAPPSAPDIPSFVSLAGLVDQDLRAPLYDPPPPPPKIIPPPPPIQVNLKLVGTVLEPGRNQALLIDSKGKLQFCAVGSTIGFEPGDILLEEVTESEATLRVRSPREEIVKLTIDESGSN